MTFDQYDACSSYDEMFNEQGQCREHYDLFKQKLETLPFEKLQQLKHSTDKAQMAMGMTFNVYHDNKGVEKILPLDIVPRVVDCEEWLKIEKGLQQRIEALNLFLQDIYNDQKILKDKVVPSGLILGSKDYLEACKGFTPPKNIWCHITGSDLVKDKDGKLFVLEDNLRCPSGVSYLLENREIIKRVFPELFDTMGVRHVSDYNEKLLGMLQFLSDKDRPTVALLTPGVYNSAYFEHSYLAQQMGVELVLGQDLVAKDKKVYMHTTKGLQQIDVLYRRIDDLFLDPEVFNPDSLLGVPGLFEAYKAGNLALANSPGTGVADDKAVYTYVPDIIKYYLQQEPILDNVPTYLCSKPKSLDYVLENLDSLVVKETNAAGGYGMLIGPKSTKEEQKLFYKKIKANPRKYIAQPTLSLSTVPTIIDENIEPRHVDLRPYILYGERMEVLPGALSRVAMVKGSLVVNSSQGGGCKDTWVLYNKRQQNA